MLVIFSKGFLVLHTSYIFAMTYKKAGWELGKRGENIAQNYLKKQFYKIIGKNYRIRGGEIDLIAKKQQLHIFIEVKTRKGKRFGTAEEGLHISQCRHLKFTIQHYLTQKLDSDHPKWVSSNPRTWRLDLIAINFLTNSFGKITHYQNIWEE